MHHGPHMRPSPPLPPQARREAPTSPLSFAFDDRRRGWVLHPKMASPKHSRGCVTILRVPWRRKMRPRAAGRCVLRPRAKGRRGQTVRRRLGKDRGQNMTLGAAWVLKPADTHEQTVEFCPNLCGTLDLNRFSISPRLGGPRYRSGVASPASSTASGVFFG